MNLPISLSAQITQWPSVPSMHYKHNTMNGGLIVQSQDLTTFPAHGLNFLRSLQSDSLQNRWVRLPLKQFTSLLRIRRLMPLLKLIHPSSSAIAAAVP